MENVDPLNKEHIDLEVEELASLETTTQSSGPKLESPSETKVEKKSESKQETILDPNKEKTINGWTTKNQSHFFYCLHRLKYYRIINNFYIFEIKKKEGRLSWAIIVISSFSSVLSLINTNIDIFPYSSLIVKWTLVFFTLITTLISSYIKKQQFIERINNIDRYLQQLTQTIEDLNITFILEPSKRENYDEFCKKYIPVIKNLSVYPDSFSPKEWKRIVYTISKYYPELIHGDGTNTELLWPWYNYSIPSGKRELGSFQNHIISSYGKQKSYNPLDYIYTKPITNNDKEKSSENKI